MKLVFRKDILSGEVMVAFPWEATGWMILKDKPKPKYHDYCLAYSLGSAFYGIDLDWLYHMTTPASPNDDMNLLSIVMEWSNVEILPLPPHDKLIKERRVA